MLTGCSRTDARRASGRPDRGAALRVALLALLAWIALPGAARAQEPLFSFVQISDSQPNDPSEWARFENSLDVIAEAGQPGALLPLSPAFVLFAGDLVDKPTDAAYTQWLDAIEPRLTLGGIPYFTVPGNHDREDAGDFQTYEQYIGPSAPWHFGSGDFTGMNGVEGFTGWSGLRVIGLNNSNPDNNMVAAADVDAAEALVAQAGSQGENALLMVHHPHDEGGVIPLESVLEMPALIGYLRGHSGSQGAFPGLQGISNPNLWELNSQSTVNEGVVLYCEVFETWIDVYELLLIESPNSLPSPVTIPLVSAMTPLADVDYGYAGKPVDPALASPSGTAPQRRLWHHDGSWWAVMWDQPSASWRIHELDPATQTWLDAGTVVGWDPDAGYDALLDGDSLQLASHVVAEPSQPANGRPGELSRFSYDAAFRVWDLDPGFPVAISDARSPTLVIDADAFGALWATWIENGVVHLNHTLGADDTIWNAPFPVPFPDEAAVGAGDRAAVVAFDDAAPSTHPQLGAVWTNTLTDEVYFAAEVDVFPLQSPDPGSSTLTVAAPAGATFLTVSDTAGFANGDPVRVATDFAGEHLTSVASVSSGTQLSVVHPLPGQASSGRLVAERPAATSLSAPAPAGETRLSVADTSGFAIGELVTVGTDAPGAHRSWIAAIDSPTELYLADGLPGPASAGQLVQLSAFAPALSSPAVAGQTVLALSDTSGFESGDLVSVDTDAAGPHDTAVLSVDSPTQLTLQVGLPGSASAGQRVRLRPDPSAVETLWVLEVAYSAGAGLEADLDVAMSNGTLFAAIRTAEGAVRLLERSQAPGGEGAWSDTTVTPPAQGQRQPLLVVDEAQGRIRVFASGPASGIAVFEKSAPLGAIGFGAGAGDPVIQDGDAPGMVHPSASRQPVTAATGLALLATNASTGRYWHAYDPLDGSPVLPVASFGATPISGREPLEVAFTDMTTGGPPTAWLWDFGDGSSSTVQNPVHTYASSGTYTVTLTASNAVGSSTRTRTGYITVEELLPPIASFDASPRAGSAPLAVDFLDTSQNFPSGWLWDFGDGATSSEQHPTHVYELPGTYSVTLTATNAAGTDSITAADLISVVAPVPSATATALADAKVESSSPSVNFGTDTRLRVKDGTSIVDSYLRFDVPDPGFPIDSATLRLYVDDPSSDGGTVQRAGDAWSETGITWANTPPWIGGPLDSAGPVARDTWVELDVSAAVTAPGTYSFVVTSSTNDSAYYWSREGSEPPELVVRAQPSAPPASDFRAVPQRATAPATVSFTDLSTETPTIWHWDFGDGETSREQNPVHVYALPGVYDVSLTVWNALGGDTETKLGYVAIDPPPPPTAGFAGIPTLGELPLSVAFSDQSTGAATSWHWDFGDGTTSSQQNPTHIYESAGLYSVSLTATNLGGSNTMTRVDYVEATTPAVQSFNPVADAKVGEANPGANYGSDTELHVDTNSDWDSYLRFEIPSLKGPWVQSALLRLYVTNASTDGGTVYPTATSWAENAITWSSAPGATGGAITSAGAVTTGSWVELDVTSAITGPGPIGFALINSSTNGASYASREGSNPPQLIVTADAPDPPVSDFGLAPASGVAPLTVTFTDLSTGPPTSWLWEFGDGATSTQRNPIHSYAAAGGYTVRLTTANGEGTHTKTVADAVVVSPPPPPTAAFSGAPLSGMKPVTVSFADESTDGPTSWLWDFGDGITSTEQHPVHTYPEVGSYTVSLIATNASGSHALTRTDYVTVDPVPPVVSFAPVADAKVAQGSPGANYGSAVDLRAKSNASTSWRSYLRFDVDSAHGPLVQSAVLRLFVDNGSADGGTLYRTDDAWSEGGITWNDAPPPAGAPLGSFGSVAPGGWVEMDVTSAVTGLGPVSFYLANGTTDSAYYSSREGANPPELVVTTAVPEPPTADFSLSPAAGTVPLPVTFSDLSTGVPAPHAWLWEFGDGATSTQQHPSHTYGAAGSYAVRLTVTNSEGSDTLEVADAVVASPPPPPTAAFSGAPLSGVVPVTVSFADESADAPTSWLWDFGDGNTSTAQHPVYTYEDVGSFTVTLTATNPSGSDVLARADYVTVSQVPPPVAAFSGSPRSGTAPVTVSFSDESTGGATSWLWEFGDGNTSTAQHPVHTYTADGSYTVTLTASNAGGSHALAQPDYVVVSPVPPPPVAAFSGAPLSGTAPLTVSFSDASTEGATGWLWEFGDGATSTAQHPVHTYGAEGSYSVTLTASNAGGSGQTTHADYVAVDPVPPVMSFAPVADAKVAQNNPGSNYGSAVDLRAKSSASSTWHSYLRFDVDAAHGPLVESAVLRLFVNNGSNDGGTLYRTDDAWSESGITWDDAPPPTGAPLGSFGAVTGGWVEMDVTPAVTGLGPVSFYLENGTTNSAYYASREGANPPELVVTTSNPGPPTADFSASPAAGSAPLPVTFSDLSTGVPAPHAWLWEFGDGATSTAQHPDHTYGAVGSYTVRLTATNSEGSHTVEVADAVVVSPPPPPPTAAFSGSPRGGDAPLSVSFSDESTGGATSWLWEFGDGATSTQQHPVHTYTAAGSYDVTLTASNAGGSGQTTSADYVSVDPPPPPPPVSTLTPVADAKVGEPYPTSNYGTRTDLRLKGSAGSRWASYLSFDLASLAGAPVQSALLRLHVTDASSDGGSVSPTDGAWTEAGITWESAPPASGPPLGSLGATTVGTWVELDVTAAVAGAGESVSFLVENGVSNSAYYSSREGANPPELVVTTGEPPPPVAPTADFTASPTSGPAPLDVAFTDASSGSPDAWSWDFGDGNTSTAQHPTHSYASPGSYTVTLTVGNSEGSDTLVRTDHVTAEVPPPIATFTPIGDAKVKLSAPDRNYGSDTTLRVKTGNAIWESYLQFDVQGLAGPVVSATLRLHVPDGGPDGGDVYAVAGGWSEAAITGGNAPGMSGPPLASLGAVANGTWVEIDVTAGVAGPGLVSFGIAGGTSNSVYYASREGANPPELVVESAP